MPYRSYLIVENQSGQALIALMEQEAARLGITDGIIRSMIVCKGE